MEKLKFILFSIVVLTLLGLIGYWSVVTLQSGTEQATSKKLEQLQKENESLKTKIEDLTSKLATSESKLIKFDQPPEIPKPKSTPTVYKYQKLIDELQKLANDKVFLKLKSSGSRVGTVQQFLNIFNNTLNKVDNDYGASTKTAIIAFQKAQGLTADGEAGPTTFSKMIDWLKKQG